MNGADEIAVIIPTLATAERAPYLLRAIESVTSQTGVRAIPLVVANGPDVDPQLLSLLARRSDVILHRLEPASLPGAFQTGCRLVATSTFSELDDDDCLLPGALALRLERIRCADRPDAVVTDGIVRGHAGDRLNISDVEAVRRDPLHELVRSNWMLPGSMLFRTETITPDVLDGMPEYLEWTFLGLVLASRFRIAFLEQPTVVHHTGLDFSIDQSAECHIGRPTSLRQLLALPLPREIREVFRDRIGDACHGASDHYCREGRWLDAWRWHLRSLFGRRGWRYLPYTRHLLALPLHSARRAADERP
jgi:hypothetical protein